MKRITGIEFEVDDGSSNVEVFWNQGRTDAVRWVKGEELSVICRKVVDWWLKERGKMGEGHFWLICRVRRFRVSVRSDPGFKVRGRVIIDRLCPHKMPMFQD